MWRHRKRVLSGSFALKMQYESPDLWKIGLLADVLKLGTEDVQLEW